VLLAAACWGTAGIFVSFILDGSNFSPLSLAFWRDLVTFLTLFAGLRIFRPAWLRVQKRDLPWLMAAGASVGAFHLFWNLAVSLNGPAVATVQQSAMPAIVAVAAWLIWRESLGWRKILAIVLTFAGTALVSDIGVLSQTELDLFGLLVGLGLPIAYASWNLFGKKVSGRYKPLTILTYAFAFGALTLLPFQFFNQSLTNPFLDWLMLGLTLGALGIFAGLGTMWTFGPQRRMGIAVLAALSAGLALTLAFQYLAMRPRPADVRLLWPAPNFPSFPSGHAVAAFATATAVGLSCRQWRWQAIALIGAGLVALSRVYLGHHYPSDVLAGSVLGASVGAACYGLIAAPGQGVSRWRWLLWPQIAVALLGTQIAYLDILPLHLLRWPGVDKVLHFLLFGMVVFWLNLWLRGRTVWIFPLAVLIPFSIAMFEEGLQFFSPLRAADPTDLLSDLLGMLLFWGLSALILSKDKQHYSGNDQRGANRLRGGH